MTRRLKLIEHSIPLEAINAANWTKNKAPKHYPTKTHKYWAHRPLATSRAILFAQLVDDPSAWPNRFPTAAEQHTERLRLHKVIEDMVEWPKSTLADRRRFDGAIEAARAEIARSVAWGLGEEPPTQPKDVLVYLQEKAPPVYDPFCGGGSIPLEAQRLGLRAYGSDLNPVAVLITKALIEFPPKFADLPPVHPGVARDKDLAGRQWRGAEGLAEDVRRYGQWMRDGAETRIGHLYPKAVLPDGSSTTVIAWLWTRTIASPDPMQKGSRVPLASSFILSSKAGREAIVKPVIDSSAPSGWRFELKTKGVTKAELDEATRGTKTERGSNFVCVLSGTAIGAKYVKAESNAGRMSQRLMAIVAEGRRGRDYLSPTLEHEIAAGVTAAAAPELEQELPSNPRWFSPPDYGMPRYVDLFTARQLTALTTLSDLVETAREQALADARASKAFAGQAEPDRRLADGGAGPAAYADTVATYLTFAISRVCEYNSCISSWLPKDSAIRSTFARQAIPMIWDFAEANVFEKSSGGFASAVNTSTEYLDGPVASTRASADQCNTPNGRYPLGASVISTDPPYYDNIGYSDLSDFFYVWLRRSLRNIFPDIFRRLVTPKMEELVATPYRHGGREGAESHFMEGMSRALTAMRDASMDIPLTIYYAFKQSEAVFEGVMSPGWAAFLQAVVDSGLQVDGTWPVRTEASNRVVGNKANALASSVVLVCRSRLDDALTSTRRDFLRELRPAMRQAILDHQTAGVPLPDRRQAAIGPGIGIFSKYSLVRETDGSQMRVATALALVNREIDQILAEGTEAFDAETRFALDWYELHRTRTVAGGAGSAIAMLQGFNLALSDVTNAGLFRAKGDAKLLTREEMHVADPNWRPSRDASPTVWEVAQHIAHTFLAEDGGVDAAGRLLVERRSAAPDILLLAERLFELATTKGENDEALVWNQLQTAWPEIERAADRAEAAGVEPAPAQPTLL